MDGPLFNPHAVAGLVSGLLFGYVLEAAGLGSPRKLTAQFRGTDWTLVKVLAVAVAVAGVGLFSLQATGLVGVDAVSVPTLHFWGIALGGLFLGAGLGLGGYNPVTAPVGLASGRGDAALFLGGMLGGVVLFTWLFPSLQDFYVAGTGPEGQTLADLLGIPFWVLLHVLVAAAALVFWLGCVVERRRGGPVDVHTILDEVQEDWPPAS